MRIVDYDSTWPAQADAELRRIGAPTHMSRRGARSLDVGVHRMLSLAATQPLTELVDRLNGFQPTS